MRKKARHGISIMRIATCLAMLGFGLARIEPSRLSPESMQNWAVRRILDFNKVLRGLRTLQAIHDERGWKSLKVPLMNPVNRRVAVRIMIWKALVRIGAKQGS